MNTLPPELRRELVEICAWLLVNPVERGILLTLARSENALAASKTTLGEPRS